ncbi:hypothetical protein C8R44DRAFT_759350, partial [Mycena epipterygia]
MQGCDSLQRAISCSPSALSTPFESHSRKFASTSLKLLPSRCPDAEHRKHDPCASFCPPIPLLKV